MTHRTNRPLIALVLALPFVAIAAGAEEVQFQDPLNDEPLELSFRPDQEITEAVETFQETGDNPYLDDQAAIDEGADLYKQYCQTCHMPDGSGRIGPNLIDDQHKYARTDTQKGMFEIVYAGGAGAMQAFGQRIDQDQILKVLAYVETLSKDSK